MTDEDKQLLAEFDYEIITKDIFLKNFSIDINKNPEFVRTEMKNAIATGDPDEIQMLLSLIWLCDDISEHVDSLNELLINPNHCHHQQIARTLQHRPDPSTIPYVRKALETNFDYLEYTCSDSHSIAKWFSWLLFSIGTKEAIDLMKEYTNADDEGIKQEMLYRLNKMPV